MKRIVLITFCVVSLHAGVAQKLITSTYLKQHVEVFLPGGGKVESELEIRIKNKQVRIESRQGPMSSIMLYSDDTGKLTQLTDMNGKKQGKVSVADFKEVDEFQIEYQNETKIVAGFTCKKAVLKAVTNNATDDRVVWYTEEIKLPFSYNFGIPGLHKIVGFPMEYENISQGIKMVHKVVEIGLNRDIDDHLFVIPEGYEIK